MRMIIQSILFIFCVLSAVWAYQVNYETRSVEKENRIINGKINSMLTRIDLLEAEWAYLNRPKRLTKLVDQNFMSLRLVPITKKHLVDSESFFSIISEGNDG